MSVRHTLFMLGCCISLVACAETNTILKRHEHLIGTWNASNSEISIKKDGYLEYRTSAQQERTASGVYQKSRIQSYMTAPISIIDENSIELNNGVNITTFKIDKAPYKVKQRWHMTINGQDYIKK
ncbi:hypothetical protein I2F27_04590 [Acinetobacter sp. B5B]|uniref:hypothetical protein n=1 Tax=Acinetobacter baretiae TaxID=2605383 RepID=UPI0018C29B61|nr:hypothetical protein [Acinetobacter baretiae]MBF7682610.1 hypothetical protein [Acinetobacter baretiae]MBF7685587.1 hypothetical protein [Acinetobacter baretiae]